MAMCTCDLEAEIWIDSEGAWPGLSEWCTAVHTRLAETRWSHTLASDHRGRRIRQEERKMAQYAGPGDLFARDNICHVS